jgi:hypothetical protein
VRNDTCVAAIGGVLAANESEAPPLYTLELVGYVTPTLNQMLRKHWSNRGKATRSLSWLIRSSLKGALPLRPLPLARVEIERRERGMPDIDGLVGGFKALLDCLQPFDAKRRPYGLGIIEGDDPKRLVLVPKPIRVGKPDQAGTTVRIWALPTLT